MISFDEALEKVRAAAHPVGTETVPLRSAHGRTLSQAAIAAVDAPPADVSAMDGYAAHTSDLSNLPATLEVVRENFAGIAESGSICAGQCARIFTGAPVPDGADCVIIQENVERDGDSVIVREASATETHIRARGSDFAKGTVLLPAGTRIGPRQLVAIAGGDLADVECYDTPKVHILVTGDELCNPGTARGQRAGIPESISTGLAAAIVQWGGTVTDVTRLTDDLETMKQAANQAINGNNLVVVAGGASVGERDYAKAMFEPLGLDLLFEKVAMKPGKPVWLGRVDETRVMGLPGNPTSAMVTARLLLAPLIQKLAGYADPAYDGWLPRKLAAPLSANGSRECFVRGVFTKHGEVIPLGNQGSGAQLALAHADVLIRRAPYAEAVPEGSTVHILPF